ncbi:MAG: fibronectin type III domain-containing protein, partial [Spirochaetaceae bacterium]|nr:fibronectin type III domain-containing protein [Spirochaetaceae bacterium]
VSWRPPASDGGSAVTTYRVYWYETGNHAATVQSVDVAPSGTGTHVHYVTGLSNGTEYGVGVVAVNAVGEGPFRNGTGAALASLPYTSPRDDVFINVPDARDNMQVRSLAAVRAGANGLRVTWSLPSGTRTLDYFRVSWYKAGSAAVAGRSGEVYRTATSYDITGLTGGQEYRIEVDTSYRLNSGAEGSYQATEVTSATPYGAPTAPRDLKVLGNDRSLAVSWAAPAADGGSPVTGYRLAWSGAGTSGSEDLAATARAHTIPNLTNDRAYTVTLAASNAYYAGPAASGGDTPFRNSAPSFGDATVAAQTRTQFVPGAPSLTLPAASGGNFGLTYSLTPAVPGLTFDAKTRVLSGTAQKNGQYQMTYRVDDGDRFETDADADTLTFTITVNANTSPTAGPIAKSTYEDIPLTFAKSDFTGAFSDTDPGDSLRFVIVFLPQPSEGRLTLGGAAVTPGQVVYPRDLHTLVFTPAADYSGSATFNVVLVDQPGASAQGAVTITVHPNDPPLAAASTAPYGSVAAGGRVTLTNSSRDTDGDTMTWLWEQTAGTTVTLSDATAESPTFTAPGRLGRLTFRLTATDEHGARATATVSLDVMRPPGAPATLTAGAGPGSVTLRWTAGAANGAAISSWWYRYSADGGTTWSAWSQGGAGAHVYHQVVTGLQDGASYTFAVRARNAAGDGAARTVAVTLALAPNRNPPVARATWRYVDRYNEIGQLIQTNLTLDGRQSTDRETPLDLLRFRWTQVRDDPTAGWHEPRQSDSSTPHLFPEPNYPVDLLYRLTVTDTGGLSDTIYLPISIRYPAGRPSLGLTRSISLGLQPGQTLSRVLPAATGGNGTLTYTLTPARAGVMSFHAATRTVTFTPASAGTWSFNYKVTDADGDADTIRVSLRAAAASTPRFAAGTSIRDLRLITGRDYGPVSSARPLSPLPLATGGDGARSYTLTPAVPGLSFDPGTRRITGTPTTAGSYAMTYRAVDSDADDSAADSATLNFTIRVVANSPPVALFAGKKVDVSVKIPESRYTSTYRYGVDLRSYFYDADGDELQFQVSGAGPGLTFSRCTSYPHEHCLYPITTGVFGHIRTIAVDTSGARATQDFRLTGLPANRAPVVTPLGQVIGSPNDFRHGIRIGTYGDYPSYFRGSMAGYVTDPDGDPLTWTARSSSDSQGKVRIEWAWKTYRHYDGVLHRWLEPVLEVKRGGRTSNWGNWTFTATVTASDPRGKSASFDIPVAFLMDDPGTTADLSFGDATVADRSWPKDKAIIPLTLPQPTGGIAPWTFSLTPAVPGLTFDAATRTLSGTPTTVAAATAMTYRVTDPGARTATLGFSITITDTAVGANPPTSAAFGVMIDEDTSHTFAAGQFPFSDADPDEHLHKLRIETLPASGTLLLNGVAQSAGATIARADLSALQYRPPADWYGIASFTFKVLDTTQRASTQAYAATVTVRPVADPPTSADFERTVAEDTVLTLASTDFAFADVDAHARSAVVIASLPDAAAGTLTLNGTAVSAGQKILAPSDSIDGTLQFTPAANWNGTATFLFGVEDTTGAVSLASSTATIRVTAVNDAPATADLTRSMDEDTTLTLAPADFTFDDIDAGDRLTAIVFAQAPRSGQPAQPAGTLSSFHGTVETVIDSGDTVAA